MDTIQMMNDKLDGNILNRFYKYLGLHPLIQNKNNTIILLQKIFNEQEPFYQYYFRLCKISCIHANFNKSLYSILKEIKNIRYHCYDKSSGEPYLIIPMRRKN